MISAPLHSIFTKYIITSQNLKFCRYVRSIARRTEVPKLIEGKVRKTPVYEDGEIFETYKDLVQSVRRSNLGDELEIEKNFLQEDYHGEAIERCDKFYAMHLSEEKDQRSKIKKSIIGRKYFKVGIETNLLTHAAKQQIRFLHNLNPLEWNCKALSECFPTTETGVKKLLKCNKVLKCPEKINAHDEQVAKRWEILKSGKFSEEISPLTQRFYREGKLVDDYSSGNPNLPTAPTCTKKEIELERKEITGEFSAIVQTYHTKEKKVSSENNSQKHVSIWNKKIKRDDYNTKNARKFKLAAEEYDYDANPEVFRAQINTVNNDEDISFSRFKELLKEETEAKLQSKYKTEYDKFVKEDLSKPNEQTADKKIQDSESYFFKISKYEKQNVDLMYERKQNSKHIYKYDENLGYQHPFGQNVKGKINLSSKNYKKGKLHKVGECIYDENGDFLYKIPT